MSEILSRCGYRCDLCLAYRPNVEMNTDNQQLLSDGWHHYFGFCIPAENIICDGCWTEKGRLLDDECPVRPCVIEHGLENCAICQNFICEKLDKRLVTFEELASRMESEISDEDRLRYIFPYENKERLIQIRNEGKQAVDS